MTADEFPRPLKEFSSGAVRASIWRHTTPALDGHEGRHYTVRIARRYHTEDGDAADSPCFAEEELPQVSAVAQAAYAWLTVNDAGHDGVRADRAIERASPQLYALDTAP